MNDVMDNLIVKNVLVTGATGYIGGRLVPKLLSAGYTVRVFVRDPQRLQGRSWLDAVEVVTGDALHPESLVFAMQGIDAAYYLIHSMSSTNNFHERDVAAARSFGDAASQAGVSHILYLGGLGDPDSQLSQHLRSRQETGEALREAGVPVTEFRAAVIVGSGSLSFEMVRYLTERVPVMVCPRWVFTRIQPVAIADVLSYLVAGLSTPECIGQVIEIGGKDILTYRDMMLGYAKVRGLRRYMIAVPVLTPHLSAYWVHWVTPIPANIARPLIEGLRNEVIVRTDNAQRLFPEIDPIDYQTAVQRALAVVETGAVETIWSDALASSQGDFTPVCLTQEQGLIIERRETLVSASPHSVFKTFTGLGGKRGWLMLNSAWHLRAAIDRLVGGVGMRRGRRHPDEIRVGDAIDFWRVEAVIPERLLRLRAEMKVPGEAWLQFESNYLDNNHTRLVQTAYFHPKGLFGLAYWYMLYPIHVIIFAGMVKKLAEKSEARSSNSNLAKAI